MSLSELFVTTFYNYSDKTDHGQGTLVAAVLLFLVWAFLIITPTFPINPLECSPSYQHLTFLLTRLATSLIALGQHIGDAH